MNQNFKAFQGEASKHSEQPDLAEYVPGHWTRSRVRFPSNPDYSIIKYYVTPESMRVLFFSC